MNPLISIIVPVYNAEKYISKCIDSILSQTFKDFELILINDGSTDNSDLICDKYASIDNKVKVFHKKMEVQVQPVILEYRKLLVIGLCLLMPMIG